MPKDKELTNHPCHLLSLPSAKRFWCRHCMTVFEDAITRWRHSRSCRYGVVDNFMRRRELEAKALQHTSVLNPVEARLEQSIQMSDMTSNSSTIQTPAGGHIETVNPQDPESFTCFICHEKFGSMEEIRLHVKYPCSNSKIITSHVPHPKHSVPVFIDALPVSQRPWHQNHQPQIEPQKFPPYQPSHSQHSAVGMEVQSEQDVECSYDTSTVSYSNDNNSSDTITPTNIYVNDQGETVIEVENLDLNTERGELSLAHLLTQLSQQGIVFDKTRSDELRCKQEVAGASNSVYTTQITYETSSNDGLKAKEDEEQPTAEDAANTLAQLAGYRSFRSSHKSIEVTRHADNQRAVESYAYSSSQAGPSRRYTITSQPDLMYEYEYTEAPDNNANSSLSNDVSGQQTITCTASYESIKAEDDTGQKIEQIYEYSEPSDSTGHSTNNRILQRSNAGLKEGTGETSKIEHIYNSGTGHYIVVDSREESTGNVQTGEGEQSVVPQHYAVEIREADHVTDAHIVDSNGAQRSNTAETSWQNNQITVENIDNGSYKDGVDSSSQHAYVDKMQVGTTNKYSGQGSDLYQETDEFAITSVSLQEIVDSNAITFEEHQASSVETTDRHLPDVAYVDQTHYTVVTTEETCATDEDPSSLTVRYEGEHGSSQVNQATVFVVTSTGIHPVTRKDI